MSIILKHLPVKKSVLTKLAVFDPSDQWPDVVACIPSLPLDPEESKYVATTSNGTIRVTRYVDCREFESDVILAMVPDKGFEREHAHCIRRCLQDSDSGSLLLASLIDGEELSSDRYCRDQAGYLTLCDEIEKEFHRPLFVIPKENLPDFSSDVIRIIARYCYYSGYTTSCQNCHRFLLDVSCRHINRATKQLLNLEDVVAVLMRSKTAEMILKDWRYVRKRVRDARENQSRYMAFWSDLCNGGRDRCSARASNSEYGSVWADQISYDESGVRAVKDYLNANWSNPPSKELERWRDDAKRILQTSTVILPIVGVFSCGKTTLINRLLGVTPKNRQFFRTSVTHNTALLTRFFYTTSDDPRNRVEFVWRKEISPIHLVTAPDSFLAPQLLRSNEFIHTFPKSIRAYQHFLKGKSLHDVEIVYRRSNSMYRTAKGDDAIAVIQELIQLIGSSEAEDYRFRMNESPVKVPIVEASLSAKVTEGGKHIPSHKLENDADWDWYQGSNDNYNGEYRRQLGFAESPEAEYLIEKCNIYMNHPLFEMITLVDTPGLNSITEHHDVITERCIREGHCFIFMAKLAKAAGHKDTDRILSMIRETIETAGIQQNKASRVFCVLNWFRTQPGSRTESDAKNRVEEFEERACKLLREKKVNIYVVDLSPEALRRPPDETLLGRPSLKVLLADLKSYITDKGAADRFNALHQRLKYVWEGWKRDIQRLEHQINGESDPSKDERKLKEALAHYQKQSKHIEDVCKHAKNECNELLRIYDGICRRLSNCKKKEEFRSLLDDGAIMMDLYNKKRLDLVINLPDELGTMMSSKTRGLFPRDAVNPPKQELNSVPTMPVTKFRTRLENGIKKWPSFCWPGVPGKNRREEYGKEFFSQDNRKNLVSSLDSLEGAFGKEFERIRQGIENSLKRRLDEIGLSAKELVSKKQQMEREKREREKFSVHVETVLDMLKR